jgi:H+-transporting ATPase
MAGVVMGVCQLAFCSAVLAVGVFGMNLGTGALRTLAFIVLVFASQATIYAVRERQRLWGPRPSLWLLASSAADVLIAAILAVGGIATTPLPGGLVGGALAAAIVFAIVLDMLKIPVFRRLKIG